VTVVLANLEVADKLGPMFAVSSGMAAAVVAFVALYLKRV